MPKIGRKKMVAKKQIDEFFETGKLALAGASRDPRKFSGSVFKELRAKGVDVVPVNPNAKEIQGEKCYRSVAEVPESHRRLVVMTPKAEAAKIIQEALDAGYKHIWLQQMAETDEAVALGEKSDANFIYKKCVMMFAEPVKGVHGVHRFLVKIFGAYPK